MLKVERSKLSHSELNVLRCLSQRRNTSAVTSCITEIGEISQHTGIRDNDEVLRALYTLEGKCLVQPEPQGDFTSNHWQITDTGLRALSVISAS
jgi:hypothetical protein